MLITLIIPVRLSPDRLYDEVARLRRILDTIPSDFYSAVIVDAGSPADRQHELVELCADRTQVKLVRLDNQTEIFSAGYARDVGVQHATTPLVLFHDIDLIASTATYTRIVDEARLRGMPENAYEIFSVSAAYLTQEFTDTYVDLYALGKASFADIQVHNAVMRQDKKKIEAIAYACSALVVNRLHFLSLGGHDPRFFGHGSEDYEIMHRLASYAPRGPKPPGYYVNTKTNQIQKYEGFRAYFALYGIEAFQRGIVLSHLWHPRREGGGYSRPDNQKAISDAMAQFDRSRQQGFPLADLTIRGKALALFPPNIRLVDCLRQAIPLLGSCDTRSENLFANGEDFVSFLKEEEIDRVLIWNPYGNEHRLGLFHAARAAGIQTIVAERGSLPDSWFFDPTGFLFDSSSYEPAKWNYSLTEERRSAARSYFEQLRTADTTLEANGSRKTARYWRHALGLGNRKVIFAPLQRPSDTVTRYFAGPCESASGFNEWLTFAASQLDKRRYVVIAKKHPLETERPLIDGVVFAPDDCHVHDLLELCDVVLTMNSGVGVIALAFGKPVICCANSFYAHPGLALAANSKEEVVDLILSKPVLDQDAVERFYAYLVLDFYSFGKPSTSKRLEPDGSYQTITESIQFSVVRVPGAPPASFGTPPKGLSLDAPVFYSFGGRTAIAPAKPAPAKPAPAKPAPAVPAPKAPSNPAATHAKVMAPRPWVRKARKLHRNPKAFFRDMITKRIMVRH